MQKSRYRKIQEEAIRKASKTWVWPPLPPAMNFCASTVDIYLQICMYVDVEYEIKQEKIFQPNVIAPSYPSQAYLGM